MCLATMTYVYAACPVHVAIFSTGAVSTLVQAAHSHALLVNETGSQQINNCCGRDLSNSAFIPNCAVINQMV